MSSATNPWIGDHSEAVKHAKTASGILANAGETEHAAFWRYVEAHGHFDSGTPQGIAAAKAALIDATTLGPPTAWFRRLKRTIADLDGRPADVSVDADRLFMSWDEWLRAAGHQLPNHLAVAPFKP